MRFVRETGLNRFAGLASIALVFAMGAIARAEPMDKASLNLARGLVQMATFSPDGKSLLTAHYIVRWCRFHGQVCLLFWAGAIGFKLSWGEISDC